MHFYIFSKTSFYAESGVLATPTLFSFYKNT